MERTVEDDRLRDFINSNDRRTITSDDKNQRIIVWHTSDFIVRVSSALGYPA